MAEAEAADETDQTPASPPPGLGFSSPALHAATQVAMIAAHGDDLEDGAGELESGDALQLELDADEEGGPRGNGGDADQVGADTEPAALDGGDGAVLCFGSPPSSPSPAIVLGGEESSNASSPQADPGLGRRLLGTIGLASPSKPPGVIHRAKLGLGLVLHLKGDQEEGAAHHRDTKEEEMVHKCSDANWSTTAEASALEGQVEEESTVGEINAERGATVDDTDAKGQQLVDQYTSDQCKQTDEDIDVGEELVLEGGLGDKWGPTNNAFTVEDWEKPVKQDECAANGNDIALEGQEKEAEQCTSDELGATMDDSAVEDQVMVELEGAIDKQGATKDGITVEDQEKAVKQCTSGELGATMDDNVVEDQETVEPEGAVHKQGDITLEDKEKAMEQCAGDKSSTTNDENTVEEKEKVVEQEDTLDKQVTIKDGNAVEYQEEVVEQGVIGKQSAIGDDIARDDQEKMVQQCTSDDLRSTMDDNAVGDQEVVEQDVIDERGGTTDGIVVEDQEKVVEQCATDELGATENGDAVEDQEVAEQGVITEMGETTYDIAVEDKEKAMEQCTTDELGATQNDDAVEDQEVAEQGVITEMGATMVDNVVEDHEVVEQSVIDERGGTTDAIAVEDQEKAVEQCAVHESRAAKDENAVEEKEKVVEQGVIDCFGAMPVDDIAAEDQEKAVEQYFSDELVTNKDENAVEEHKKVAEQGVIDGSGGTKDDIDVEEQENVKEQGIIDKWDTVNDGTTLEDQKKVAELCIGDEQRAVKDVVAVRNQENMLQQSISDERGATKGEFTVENREVVERVCHEWGATEVDLAVDTAASGGVSGISSSEVVSVSINGSDGETVKKEKVKLCVRYPQRPGKLNCPFYMSTGCYSYGLSCHFNHPPLKANSDVSSVPSEQGTHGVAEILELNCVGLPIQEGARNCTYYMRNGTCRYGKKCHYNHPEQVIDAQFFPPTGWEDNVLPSSPHLKKYSDHATLDDTSYLKKSSDDATLDDTSYSKRSSDHATLDGTSYSKKSSDHATLDNTSSSSEVLPPNILRMLLPPQKVPPSTEGKVMKVKKDPDWSSASDDSDGCCSADSSDGPLCKQEHVDYPGRPGRPECPFYMRFGDCKFASACKYHHSKDRFPCRYHSKDPSLGEEPIEYPERSGEPECPFYMKSRFCKFGAECKFHHPKDLTPSRRSPTTTKKSVAAANEHHPAIRITPKDHICQQQQHPERPGQPDCRYYMQFGKCKYLSACIFHHPKDRLPSGWHPSDPAHSDQYDTWQPTNRIEDLLQQAQIGPEIPGMPECPFYMKTGTCRFGSACKFRHPKDRCSTTEEAIDQGTDLAYDNFTRSVNVPQQQEQTMYPERPGEPECSYYMRHGSCKFQMNCKYHHPRDRLSKKPYDSGTYH